MKKLKAEIWDKVQFIFRNYYDRMVHGAMYFNGTIDINFLRKSLFYIVKKYPVLRASFKSNPINPYWKVNDDINEGEMVKHVICEDLQKSVCEALAKEIDYKAKLQFEVVLHYSQNKSAISVIVNHMCMDGADFKYFLGKIAEGYNLLAEGKDIKELELKDGTRCYKQLYKDMSEEEAKKAKGLYVNVSRTGIKSKFAFSDETNCITRFNFDKFTADELSRMKAKGKEVNATVNDILITAFARAISKQLVSKDGRLAITNMKNLRHNIKNGQSENMTNLTGFMPCVLENVNGSFEEVLSEVCRITAKAKDDKYCGLYGLPLMALAFRLFPFSIAELAIKIGYENPLIGMSNIGIISEEITDYKGVECFDAFMTGATKFKPYIQLTSTTFKGVPTLCIAQKCGEEDDKKIKQLLADTRKELVDFLG